MENILKAISITLEGVTKVTELIGIENIDLKIYPEWVVGHYLLNKSSLNK